MSRHPGLSGGGGGVSGVTPTAILFGAADGTATWGSLFWTESTKKLAAAAGSTMEWPITPAASSILFGNVRQATGIPQQVDISNTTGISALRVGQATNRGLGFNWAYNATPANAYGELNTYGYTNQIKIDGLHLLLQTLFVGNVVIGGGLATTATTGFLCGPSCAGVPTGIPTPPANTIAYVYDRTNDDLYAYNAGWVDVDV